MEKRHAYFDRVYAVVRRIPCGMVASYGLVAAMTGYPRRARMVGQAMSHAPDGESIPWHRVVHSDGSLIAGYEREQRARLAAEGVRFRAGGRADMQAHLWRQS